MNYSLKSALIVFVSFSIFAGIVNLLIITSSYSNKNEHEFWLIHTYEVIDLVGQLKVQLKSAEAGQRGYLLTEDLEYLSPYQEGVNLSLNTFEALKLKTKDNPTQQKRLSELKDILNSKLSELEQTIQLVKKGTKVEAENIVKTDIGRYLMEEIELVLLAFEQEERHLLDRRTRDYIAAKNLHSTSVILLEFVYVVLIIWLIYSFRYKVLEPLKVLNMYIQHYPESDKFEIAKESNCIEVSELALGIKSRCLESEQAILRLTQNEREAVEQVESVTQKTMEYCTSNEIFTGRLLSVLQKYNDEQGDSISQEDVDDMKALITAARESNRRLGIDLKRRAK